jgi:hypothetical protein
MISGNGNNGGTSQTLNKTTMTKLLGAKNEHKRRWFWPMTKQIGELGWKSNVNGKDKINKCELNVSKNVNINHQTIFE